MPPLHIFLLSGTHWDREWYLTFQEFRFRLVDVLDELFVFLKREKAFVFLLDGQTRALEDYLEIRSEKRPEAEAFIREGRLRVGPWYCMPDEFLVSGESLIRNLQTGCAVARTFGAEPVKNGYLCDCFGHTAQMPQILAGFGIRQAVVGRGTNEHTTPAFFRWRSPDGSECLTFKLADGGGYGDFFVRGVRPMMEGLSDEKLDDTLKAAVEREIGRTSLPVVLLFDATDHMPVHQELIEIAARLRQLYPDAQVTIGDLEEAVKAAEKAADATPSLPVRNGELMEPAKEWATYLHLIPHTLSSRVDLKRENDYCETLLEKWVMPTAALAELRGRGLPKTYIETAWRLLFQNHAHDSICGCSIDQVHRDMCYRFDQVRIIAGEMINRALGALLPNPLPESQPFGGLAVFNPLPYVREEVVDAELYFPSDWAKRYEEPFGYEAINSFRLYDREGTEVPYTLRRLSRGSVKGDLHAISFQTQLAPMGFTFFRLVPQDRPSRQPGTLRTGAMTAANDLVSLRIRPDGTLDLTDQRTRRTYTGLCGLADDAEIGDGWFHVAPAENEEVVSDGVAASVQVIADGPNETVFRIIRRMTVPARIDRNDRRMQRLHRSKEERVLIITADIRLQAGLRGVKVELTVDNTAEDHRLRLLLPTGLTGTYFASGAFAMLTRSDGPAFDTRDWREAEAREKPMHGIVGRRGDGAGLAFVAGCCGLHECAALPGADGTIAVTLLRSFARTEGTDMETDGQVPGKHTCSFLLLPLDDGVTDAALQRAQDALAAGVRVIPISSPPDVVQEADSLLQLSGETLCYSILTTGPVKDSVTVRVYNLAGSACTGALRWKRSPLSAVRTRLDGHVLMEVALEGDTVPLLLGPWEIGTYTAYF